jgi:hypothetical protein
MKAMEVEARRLAAFRVQLGGEIATVLQQLDAGQRGAEANVEWAPQPGLAQGSA